MKKDLTWMVLQEHHFMLTPHLTSSIFTMNFEPAFGIQLLTSFRKQHFTVRHAYSPLPKRTNHTNLGLTIQ